MNKLDILIQLAREDVLADQAAEFMAAGCDVRPSPRETRIFRRMMRRYERVERPRFYGFRVAAVAVLLLISLACGACMCVPEIREATWQAVYEWYEKYVVVSFKEPEVEEPFVPLTALEEIHRPSYIPLGYTSTCMQKPVHYRETIMDTEGEVAYTFIQRLREGDAPQYDHENLSSITEITVNGVPAVLLTYETDSYSLYWQDRFYVYTLTTSHADLPEMLLIAESVTVTMEE